MYYAIYKEKGIYAPSWLPYEVHEFVTKKARTLWLAANAPVGDAPRKVYAAPKENLLIRKFLEERALREPQQLTL